jgi:hypothetical protein
MRSTNRSPGEQPLRKKRVEMAMAENVLCMEIAAKRRTASALETCTLRPLSEDVVKKEKRASNSNGVRG